MVNNLIVVRNIMETQFLWIRKNRARIMKHLVNAVLLEPIELHLYCIIF
jgi:hypothetical protein